MYTDPAQHGYVHARYILFMEHKIHLAHACVYVA